MKIETYDDWLAVSGCCCTTPDTIDCVLKKQYELKTGSSHGVCYLGGYEDSEGNLGFYRRVVGTISAAYENGGYSSQSVNTTDKRFNAEGVCTYNTENITTGDPEYASPPFSSDLDRNYTESLIGTAPGNLTYTSREEYIFRVTGNLYWSQDITIVYSDAYTPDIDTVLSGDADEALASASYSPSGSSGYSSYSRSGFFPTGRIASKAQVRHRWQIPQTCDLKWVKVTWDVIEEPVGWFIDPPARPRTFFEQDKTWEWLGPGDPENPESWVSPWFEITPPIDTGIKRVVNVRYEFFRASKLGVIPPVLSGEQIADDEL